MISKSMQKLVDNSTVMNEMFEEGKRLKKIYGDLNVFDFNLGNPNVAVPKKVGDTIKRVVDEEDSLFLHGYMSNAGYLDVREKVAESINKREGTKFGSDNIVMCVGASGGLNIIFRTILDQDDEVIVFTPYFSEYDNYVGNFRGKMVRVKANEDNFLPDLYLFEKAITSKTKAVIINTPNNPTGVIYDEEIIMGISEVLEKKEKEYKHDIYLISDEPYREIVYDKIKVPYVTKYYNNTFVVYSFSKALSLPGERIGYVVIPDEMNDSKKVIMAVGIANRIVGGINAPSLMQRVIAECLDEKVDIDYYRRNRDELISIMDECGFSYAEPQGTFYLFVKTPIDDKEFCKIAKNYNLLFVPASSFYGPGYVRIAYCVSYETIVGSRDAFIELSKEFK